MAAALRTAAGRQLSSRYTIAHLSRLTFLRPAFTILFVALVTGDVRAQTRPSSSPEDAFAEGRWRAEFFAQAAIEAWNYNPSHEELYGLVQGVTYGLREGLVLLVRQRVYYISQRRNDSRLLGITTGLRRRVYQHGRTAAFVQFDVGLSDAAVALPPGGTRFNYLAIGGGGITAQINRRLQAIATLEVVHVSNAGLAGNDRNPDIEAIGPSVGITIGF
jgi:hypothetical protein